MGAWVFANCTSLSSITILVSNPLDIQSGVFYNVDMTTCTLYVPAGSVEAYKNAEVWGEFENIFAL